MKRRGFLKFIPAFALAPVVVSKLPLPEKVKPSLFSAAEKELAIRNAIDYLKAAENWGKKQRMTSAQRYQFDQNLALARARLLQEMEVRY